MLCVKSSHWLVAACCMWPAVLTNHALSTELLCIETWSLLITAVQFVVGLTDGSYRLVDLVHDCFVPCFSCYNYAAVLRGCNMVVAIPSVCQSVQLSVTYELLTGKQKYAEKPKLVQPLPRAEITDVPIFSFKGQRWRSYVKSIHKMTSVNVSVYLSMARQAQWWQCKSGLLVEIKNNRCRLRASQFFTSIGLPRALGQNNPPAFPPHSSGRLHNKSALGRRIFSSLANTVN